MNDALRATRTIEHNFHGWLVGWFPNLTRAYDNNGCCPRQKFVLAYYSY